MPHDPQTIRAPEHQLQVAPENRLANLERVLRRFGDTEALLKRGGHIAEV